MLVSRAAIPTFIIWGNKMSSTYQPSVNLVILNTFKRTMWVWFAVQVQQKKTNKQKSQLWQNPNLERSNQNTWLCKPQDYNAIIIIMYLLQLEKTLSCQLLLRSPTLCSSFEQLISTSKRNNRWVLFWCLFNILKYYVQNIEKHDDVVRRIPVSWTSNGMKIGPRFRQCFKSWTAAYWKAVYLMKS